MNKLLTIAMAGLISSLFTAGASGVEIKLIYDADAGSPAVAVNPEATDGNDADLTTPGEQNWTGLSFGTGATWGPIDDGGILAWGVTTTASGEARLQLTPNASDVAAAAIDGWQLSAVMRMPVADQARSSGMALRYDDPNGKYYELNFGTTAGGDLIAGMRGAGPGVTVSGSGYHDVDIIFDAVTDTVDVLVDGNLIQNDIAGLAGGSASGRTYWGGLQSKPATGYFQQVTWGVVPEPATMTMLALGGLAILASRRPRNC